MKKILRWGAISLGFIIAVLLLTWAIMNVIWGAELRKTIAEIKARGEPMTIAEIVPAYVPPEKNAAVELNKAFALMCGDKPGEQYIPFKQGKLKPSLKALDDYFYKKSLKPVSAEETKKNLELVDSPEFMEIFNLLNAAALKPGCNFDLKYDDGIAMLLPNLGFVRTSARLQSFKALSLANKGNITGACDILMTAVKVANLLQDEPNLIFQLVRVACLQITADALNNIADNFQIPEENAKSFIAELETINTTEPFKKSLIAEGVCLGQTVFDRSSCHRMFYLISKVVSNRDYYEYLRIMSLYSKVCDKPFFSSSEEIKRIKMDLNHIPRYCLLSALLTPDLTGIFKHNAELRTKLSISRLKLALNIYKGTHGAFPENLEQLKPEILREIPIDELTGNPLTYKKEGGKYVLFSAAVQKLEEERKQETEKYKREQEEQRKKAAGK